MQMIVFYHRMNTSVTSTLKEKWVFTYQCNTTEQTLQSATLLFLVDDKKILFIVRFYMKTLRKLCISMAAFSHLTVPLSLTFLKDKRIGNV